MLHRWHRPERASRIQLERRRCQECRAVADARFLRYLEVSSQFWDQVMKVYARLHSLRLR